MLLGLKNEEKLAEDINEWRQCVMGFMGWGLLEAKKKNKQAIEIIPVEFVILTRVALSEKMMIIYNVWCAHIYKYT